MIESSIPVGAPNGNLSRGYLRSPFLIFSWKRNRIEWNKVHIQPEGIKMLLCTLLKNYVMELNKVMNVGGAKESHRVHQLVARKIKKIVLLPQYLLFVQ